MWDHRSLFCAKYPLFVKHKKIFTRTPQSPKILPILAGLKVFLIKK